jgi:hypothetical protein
MKLGVKEKLPVAHPGCQGHMLGEWWVSRKMIWPRKVPCSVREPCTGHAQQYTYKLYTYKLHTYKLYTYKLYTYKLYTYKLYTYKL